MPPSTFSLRLIAIALCTGLCGGLCACDPPPVPAVVTAPEPAGDIRLAPEDIPAAVMATREALLAIAETGQPHDMARIANATPGFVSNSGGMPHRDYWYLKYRTGDWPMAHLGRVLAYPPARDAASGGEVYVWPYMARLAPDAISEPAAREIDALAGEGTAAAMRNGAPWPGYSLGLRKDGVWLYFYSGAEMAGEEAGE